MNKGQIGAKYRRGEIESIARLKFWFGKNQNLFKKGLIIEDEHNNNMVTIWRKRVKKADKRIIEHIKKMELRKVV